MSSMDHAVTSGRAALLDLPVSIRFRIYYFTGLRRSCPIVLAGVKGCSKHHRGSYWTRFCTSYQVDDFLLQPTQSPFDSTRQPSIGAWECFCPLIPTSLFMVCKTLSTESLTYFYFSNKFALFVQRASDLDVIYSLSPLALSALRSLLVQLNRWQPPGPEHYESLRDIRRACPSFCNDSEIRFSYESFYITEAWQRLCKYLSQRIQPNLLRLTLICDTFRLLYAEQVCRDTERLPRLQSCTIRLSPLPSCSLNSLAQTTAERMVIRPQKPFCFLRLPSELRLRVLQFTHLNPANGAGNPPFHRVKVFDGELRPLKPRGMNLRNCCHTCTETKDICCCPCSRAAYSTTCSCLLPPTNLFLVSKQMKREAEDVYFKSARFEFHGDVSEIITYFDLFGKQNLWLVQYIQITFSSQQLREWDTGTCMKWHMVVSYIRNHVNIGRLCLVVDVQENWIYPDEMKGEGGTESDWRYAPTYDMICDIGIELVALRGLQDLHLKFPWFMSLERLFEQEVMGSDYDSHHGVKHSKDAWPVWIWTLPKTDKLPTWHATTWKSLIGMGA